MAIVKMCRPGKSLRTVLNYITREDKTTESLMHGINCSKECTCEDMMITKQCWNKTGGRQYMHLTINYHAQETYLHPSDVLEYTKRLISETEAFKGFETLIAVHTDKAHLHAHVVLNSVSSIDGHKIQFSRKDLQHLKDRCNMLSLENGLHVPKKGLRFDGEEKRDVVSWNKNEYRLLMKVGRGMAVSWKANLASIVAETALKANNREEFVRLLHARNVKVEWSDNRKHLTFTDADGNKSRGNKLQRYIDIPLDKAELLNLFRDNAQYNKNLLGEHLVDMHYVQGLADALVKKLEPDADEDVYIAFWERIETEVRKGGYWQTVAFLKDELQKAEQKNEHEVMHQRDDEISHFE